MLAFFAPMRCGVQLPDARLNILARQRVPLRDVQHAVFAVAALVHTTAGASKFHNKEGQLSVSVTWTAEEEEMLDEEEAWHVVDGQGDVGSDVSLHASFLHGERLEEKLKREAERAIDEQD
tara:strand:- start:314 stop:676 length:363 start_codon:yes stop_codon:yes gene_type:complete